MVKTAYGETEMFAVDVHERHKSYMYTLTRRRALSAASGQDLRLHKAGLRR